MKLAKKLDAQIDRTVVYWTDFEGDKNYANRNPVYQNQFWVMVKPQRQQREFDRLVLAGLYRGVLDRKRLFWALPSQKYQCQVACMNCDHQKVAYELPNKINAFISTIDAEFFLKEYGIETSPEVREWFYEDRRNRLNDYIRMQRDSISTYHKIYQWYKETEISNLIDYGNITRADRRYLYNIQKLIKQIKPHRDSNRYLRQIGKVSDIIEKAYQNYPESTVKEVHDEMLYSLIKELGLEDKIDLKRLDVLESPFFISESYQATVYSYVPDGLHNQEFIVVSMRYVREMLALIEEYCNYYDNSREYPLVGASLIDTAHIDAYANGEKGKGYYISFTTGLFMRLKEIANSAEFAEDYKRSIQKYWTNEEIINRLYKYAVYFVTAHEYAHILNGDCEDKNNTMHNPDKELEADNLAKKMLLKLICVQGEYHDMVVLENNISLSHIRSGVTKWAADVCLAKKAVEIAYTIRQLSNTNIS